MVTPEQKAEVLKNIQHLSINEIATMTNLKSAQVRWIMHTHGISKGTNRGRPGTNRYVKVPKDIFNVHEKSCWITG